LTKNYIKYIFEGGNMVPHGNVNAENF